MRPFMNMFIATIACAVVVVATAAAQTAKDIRGPSPLIPIDNEPTPRLIVDPPLLRGCQW
jgi:hypothetical protein